MSEIRINKDITDEEAMVKVSSVAPGDVVLYEPGTYQHKLYLAVPGVTLAGVDPDDPPVFDFSDADISTFPGPNNDNKYLTVYAFATQADDLTIRDIVIKGAKSGSIPGAGLYMGPYGVGKEPAGPGTIPNNLLLERVAIIDCDQGLQGLTTNVAANGCFFSGNGMVNDGGRHNVYLQGGSAVFDECVFADSLGTNIQSRASYTEVNNCLIGACGASGHQLQMVTNKAEAINGQPFEQKLVIKNTSISGVRNHSAGMSKFVSMINGNNYDGLSMIMEMDGCTIYGQEGDSANVVLLLNRPGTALLSATLTNNIFNNLDRAKAFRIEDEPPYFAEETGNTWTFDSTVEEAPVDPPDPVDPSGKDLGGALGAAIGAAAVAFSKSILKSFKAGLI